MSTTAAVIVPPPFSTFAKEVKPADNQPGNIDVRLSSPGFTSPAALVHLVPAKIKPASLNFDPWIGFGTLDNRTFIDDFCHQKELTLKVEANTYNGAVIKIKETAKISKQSIKTKQEIKLFFPIYARMASALHFRLTDSDTRVHYDHGIDTYKGHSFNLYGSFGFLRNWNKYNLKLGFQLFENNSTIDNRLKFNLKEELTWFMRATTTINEFRAGVITSLDLSNRELLRKDLIVGYKNSQYDVSLKAEQPFDKKTENYEDWKQWFHKYTLTAVYERTKKQKYGLELSSCPKQNTHLGTLLIEYRYSDKGFTKVKLDTLWNLTFLIKKTLTTKLALSLGVSTPLRNKVEKNKVGIQLNLNI